MEQADRAKSFVTKAFLIDIITRDIGVFDAILELVDNSIDRAIEKYSIDASLSLLEHEQHKVLSGLPEKISVKIDIVDNSITIEDNCGGISREDIISDVFIFGLPKTGIEYKGLSAFGIGMKRAFFKLGKIIELRTHTETDETSLIWDINKWIDSGDTESWDIPFLELKDSSLNYLYSLTGTIIKISDLNPSVSTRITQPEFLYVLRERLKTSYGLFLKSDIQIILNGELLEQSLPNLVTSDEISYTKKNLSVMDVDVQIIAGITPIDDRTPRGWYIFCNGRMVLAADKTAVTGWGMNMPQYHPKFNHFIGYVLFNSTDVKALPWTSTKWGIESDSLVYNSVLEEMRLQAIPILDVLDRWKDVKEDEESTAMALKDLLINGKPTPIYESGSQEKSFTYKPIIQRPDVTRINFVKNRLLVQKAKEFFGNPKMNNASVGELIFDYFVERELE
jgi:hypothetical protein